MKTDAAPTARILLVDDNRLGIAARKTILENLGYTVESALSGEEGWATFQQRPFDIVVTDFRMGGMDGIEFIRLIRATETPTRVVLLSGFAACLGMTTESTGADEVLLKNNTEAQDLARAVKRLLSQSARRGPDSVRRTVSRAKTRAV